MEVKLVTPVVCSVILMFFLAGCELDQKEYSNPPSTQERVDREIRVDNDCDLPSGTVFLDCVSSSWQLPSYYYMPMSGDPGREVYASEASDHFVHARIAGEKGGEGNRVVDVVYGEASANALVRFRVSENQPYPADMRDFRGGALNFDLRVLEWGEASDIGVRVECGWPCSSETVDLNVDHLNRWQSYSIAAQDLVEKGLDLSKLDSAVNFVPTWGQMQGVHFQIDNLRWVKGDQDASLPYQPKKNWSEIAQRDLNFIYEMALKNHPGAIDPQNPEFRVYLDSGYAKAKAMAEKATNRAEYKTALSFYMAGFADGHFEVNFTEVAASILWPGFSVQKQGDNYLVSHLQEGAWELERPKLGDKLVSCDGRKAEKLMEDEVLRYFFRDHSVEAAKWQHAWRLFAVGEIGDRELYERCVFSSAGNTESYKLYWRMVDRELVLGREKTHSYPDASKIEELEEGLYWVYLPSFMDLRGRRITAIEHVVEQLKRLPENSTVIFDMRFNGGGNSRWGFELLGALQGKLTVGKLYHDATSDSYAEFRASQGNADYYRNKSHDQTLIPQSRALYEDLYTGIEASYENGKDWYRVGRADWLDSALPWFIGLFVSSEPRQRAVLLTSPGCASACLDFADAALQIPGTVHMGQETSADTYYLDVRIPPLMLPSRQGMLTLPMKVWRNRLREHNESYVPDYLYEGDITDTQAVKDWTVKMLNLKNDVILP